MEDTLCMFEPCEKLAKSAGLCKGHYDQKWRGKELRPLRPTPQKLFIDVENQVRECGICHQVKSFTDFHKASKAAWTGIKSQCKPCDLAYQSQRNFLYRHGLTSEQRKALLDGQQGRCSICHREVSLVVRQPSIDHDHRCCPGKVSCGKCVRGILCGPCNTGLGMLGDDIANLERAAEYLKRYGQYGQNTQ